MEYCAAVTLHGSYRGVASPLQIIRSSRSSTDIGVVFDFDPSTAQVAARFGRYINHMGVFSRFVRGVLTSEFEIQLGRLVGKGLGIIDRCLD